MIGRIVTTIMVMVTLLLVVIGNATSASALDATSFDPKKTYAVVAGSALMGDPAIFVNLANGQTGGTIVSTVMNPQTGLVVMASLVEPGQNGQPGGGHGILFKPQEAAKLINLLRKGPSWVKIAQDNNVSDYSKTVGMVRGEAGKNDAVSVVFVVSATGQMSMQLEQQIANNSKKFQFDVSAAMKFSNQLLHYLSNAGSEFAPKNPNGDAEKDKLFN